MMEKTDEIVQPKITENIVHGELTSEIKIPKDSHVPVVEGNIIRSQKNEMTKICINGLT